MVSVAIGTRHYSGMMYICPIRLTSQNIIQEMPMLGAWVLPSGLEPVLLLEKGVYKLVL